MKTTHVPARILFRLTYRLKAAEYGRQSRGRTPRPVTRGSANLFDRPARARRRGYRLFGGSWHQRHHADPVSDAEIRSAFHGRPRKPSGRLPPHAGRPIEAPFRLTSGGTRDEAVLDGGAMPPCARES
jgi:hypothetical protein